MTQSKSRRLLYQQARLIRIQWAVIMALVCTIVLMAIFLPKAKAIEETAAPALELEPTSYATPEIMPEPMFKVAMAAYRAELQDNDCGSYSAEGRQFMIDKGLMVGGNPLPNGEPNYMWQDFLTREQFATVLFRYAKALGIA